MLEFGPKINSEKTDRRSQKLDPESRLRKLIAVIPEIWIQNQI
jgi:hypothetical protein